MGPDTSHKKVASGPLVSVDLTACVDVSEGVIYLVCVSEGVRE